MAAEDTHATGAAFLAALSREMRGPLRGMTRSLARLSAAGHDPELVERAVHALEQALQQEAELADDLLVLAQLATRRLPLATSTFDIVDRLRASVERHRARGRERQIDLTVDAPHTPVLVRGDARRLEQVLDRLLDQTLAGAAAGRPVTASVRAADGYCEIEISATGAADGSDGNPGPLPEVRGAALGVVLSHHVLAAHGGRIDISAGRRPAFRVSLPGAAGGSADPRRPSQVLDRVRILIVDDDETCREALAEALTALGAEATTASCVLDALTRLTSDRFDAVCSDIEMPGDSGFVLARSVRATEHDGSRLPLVAISGVMDQPHAHEARQAGFDATLPKPIDVGQLARAIRALVGGSAGDQLDRNSPTVANDGT